MELDVNQADRDAFLLLPRINRKEAEEIVAERSRRGGFSSFAEFMDLLVRLGVSPHHYAAIVLELDVNQADRDAFLLLPGINRKEAEEIIAERSRRGGFSSFAEFMDLLVRFGVSPHHYAAIGKKVVVRYEADLSARVIDF